MRYSCVKLTRVYHMYRARQLTRDERDPGGVTVRALSRDVGSAYME
jgi:hypothetical protein